MKIRIAIEGALEGAAALRAMGERLVRPLRPLLEVIAAEMQTLFQKHIQDRKGPDGEWPQLADATHFIRAYYGYGAADPRLIRAGDLLHSIQTLGIGEDFAETGTLISYAGVLNEGGEVTDEHGRTRTVQAFPFIWLGDQEISDLMTLASEYFFGGGERAAA